MDDPTSFKDFDGGMWILYIILFIFVIGMHILFTLGH